MLLAPESAPGCAYSYSVTMRASYRTGALRQVLADKCKFGKDWNVGVDAVHRDGL